ncbi:MAG: hypothetical protein KF851_00540 [Pirellulaceae bacterium]|nr:hypothetical protein [Pirellulaceae bacterium]
MKLTSGIWNRASFSLSHLFLAVTIVGVYLACFRWSEQGAMALLLIGTPVVLRTIIAQDKFRQEDKTLSVAQTSIVAIKSLSLVLVAYFASCVGFVATCLMFGVLAALFGVGVGLGDLWIESMIFGSLIGTVLGMVGGLFTGAFVIWYGWDVPENLLFPEQRSQ